MVAVAVCVIEGCVITSKRRDKVCEKHCERFRKTGTYQAADAIGKRNAQFVGTIFGRLIVLSESRSDGKDRWWLCQCECGKRKDVRQSLLKRGATRSCGCLQSSEAARRNRKWPLAANGEKFCPKCEATLCVSKFSACGKNKDKLGTYCKQCAQGKQNDCRDRRKSQGMPSYSVVETRKLRIEVFSHYCKSDAPFCQCCGDTTNEFLTIDHIEGGGNKHRKEINRRGSSIYRWLRQNRYPAGFRVLCMNCNHSFGHYGYCPHQVTNKEGAIEQHA